MSAETDYLASWFTSTAELSLTVISAQRPRSRPGPVVLLMPTTGMRTMAERARVKACARAHPFPRSASLHLLGRVFQMSWIHRGSRRAG